MINAVIFDMDGVLIDAKEWHYEALNRALGLFGYSISRYEHLVTYDGLPTSKKLQMLTMEQGLPRSLHHLISDLKQKYTVELVHAHCKPIFQHEYALSKLKERGYKLGVASNAIRQSVELMLGKANLLQYFDVILSNQDVKKPKPDPEVYLTATKLLNIDNTRSLVVEDNAHGIAAAKASGCHVMIVESTKDVELSNILKNIESIG